ncbi:MAG: hypothetical protein JSV52_01130 [Candidatus Zixiibacteriota bacterium]|nr:MAG: hypothetical protein JSV52_01130 [candidate division Zixibacteria bacterium]
MEQVNQSAKLLIDKEVEGGLLASPLFWRQMASEDGESDWIWGIVTTEFDLEQDGSVTVIQLLRGSAESLLLTTLKGFEVYEGDAVTVGDWDGDGENELIVIDADGQLRVFRYEGRAVDGMVTHPVLETIIRRRPAVATFGDGSRPILSFVSEAAPYIEAVGAVHAYQFPGQPLPGLPMELDPPSISSVVMATAQSGAKRLAFVRENGSICVYDLSRKILHQIARVKPDLADQTVIAAADVDADGRDEIIFAHGGDCVYALSVSSERIQRSILAQRADSEFVALAPGVKADGQSILCFYDRGNRQFGFFSGGQLSWYEPEDVDPSHKLISLSTGPAIDEGGSAFVAVFYNPAGSIEILLLDSNANTVSDSPIRIKDFCPFIDGDTSMVLVPSVFYEASRSRLLLLAGLYPCGGDDPARVHMYEIDCSQR